jgi:hypothetical protein
VFSGLPIIERLNLLWLHGFRRRPEWASRHIVLIQRAVGGNGISIGDLFNYDDGTGELKATVWHLIWCGRSLDLSSRIDEDSYVTLVEGLWDG